jgi:hypothetical protein
MKHAVNPAERRHRVPARHLMAVFLSEQWPIWRLLLLYPENKSNYA